jgi:diguanylate cyclase (GGDEF)-like protein/PAS domain S-box-containing protein
LSVYLGKRSQGVGAAMAGESEEKYRGKTKQQIMMEMNTLQARVAELEKVLSKSEWVEESPKQGELVAAETIEGMPDGVMLVDMSGEIIYVNKAFEKLLGYKANELIGTSALELPTYSNSKDRVKAQRYLRNIIEESSAKPIDMSAITKDGEEIPINFTASVIKDAQGNPKTLVAVIRNISECKQAEESLRDSSELARGMLEAATTGVYFLQDGRFLYVNRLFEQISGYTYDELVGTYPLDLVHPDDREIVRAKAIEVLKGQSSSPYEFRLLSKDSVIVWVLDWVVSIRYKGKRSVLGMLMDITERKHAEEEVNRYTKQLETLFNIGTTVSQTLNLEELLVNVLDKVLEVTGVEVTGIFLLDEKKHELVLRAYRGMSPSFVRELRALSAGNGVLRQVLEMGKPLLVENVSADHRFNHHGARKKRVQSFAAVSIMAKERILGVMGIGSYGHREFPDWEVRMLGTVANQVGMAIENAQLYEHALELAFTDSLTGLYNRRYLMDQVEREFIRAQRNKAPLSLVMVDLDGLKAINDRFGHHVGDRFLKEVAGIVKVNTRASDIAARWGGDEFMLLAPGTDSRSAIKIAERIRAQVERYKMKLEGEEVGITVSAGIVSYPDHAPAVAELLKKADQAMYNAKKGGKNQASIFSPLKGVRKS